MANSGKPRSASESDGKLLRIIKVLRIFKIVRILKAVKIIE